MQKKLVYIGIGLIILAILVIFIAPSVAIQFKTSTYNTTLAANQLLTVPLNFSQEAFLLLVYKSNSTISFFVFNNSAYHSLNTGSNIYPQAVALEGKGALSITPNSTVGSFPGAITNATSGSYFNPNSTILPPGNYYAVFQGNPIKTTPLKYQINVNDSLSSNLLSIAALGVVFLIALVGGLIAIAYGIIRKDASSSEAQADEQAKKAYAQLDKKHAPKRQAAGSAKSSGKKEK